MALFYENQYMFIVQNMENAKLNKKIKNIHKISKDTQR